jgi:hypothetical protein
MAVISKRRLAGPDSKPGHPSRDRRERARVRIFQAEARTTWSTPRERISGGRGKEMLLREIFQNC